MIAGALCPSCAGGFGGGPDAESASLCLEDVEEGDFVEAVGSQVQVGSVVPLATQPVCCELVVAGPRGYGCLSSKSAARLDLGCCCC